MVILRCRFRKDNNVIRILDRINKIKNKQALIKIQEVVLKGLKDSKETTEKPTEVTNKHYINEKYDEYQKIIGYADQFIMFNRYSITDSNVMQKKK